MHPPSAMMRAYASQPFAYQAGTTLVVSKFAPLPGVCVKCGAAHALVPRSQVFTWTPPWVWAFSMISPLLAVMVAAIVRKRSDLILPICVPCNNRWRSGGIYYGLSFLPGTLAFVLGITMLALDIAGSAGIGVFLVGLLALVVVPVTTAFSYTRPRRLRATQIDDHAVWISGVHPTAIQAVCAAYPPAQMAYVQPGQLGPPHLYT